VRSPAASVIIDNFNYGRFLADAIDSALAQTYPDTEVVVVDDGSTDDSREVIARYRDRVVAVLQDNSGMAAAFNAGYAVSRGVVVLFLDSDDVLMPTAIERAADVLTADAGVAKVHWPLDEIDAAGARTGRRVPGAPLGEGDLRAALLAGGPDAYRSPPTSGNAWSRRVLERVMPVPTVGFDRHAEMYLVTVTPVFGEVRTLAEPLSCYRLHGSNDYATRPAEDRHRRNLDLYRYRSDELARAFRQSGESTASAERWMTGNPSYAWMTELDRSLRDLKQLVPDGRAFILVDDGQWGGGQVLAGRTTLPFTERDGVYWGPPSDDAEAGEEFERLWRAHRPVAFAVAQPSFWWFEQYPRFFSSMQSRFPRVLDTKRLVVFDIHDGLTDVPVRDDTETRKLERMP
jgi:glycosyltransferase involved in cell wall biosynthesis